LTGIRRSLIGNPPDRVATFVMSLTIAVVILLVIVMLLVVNQLVWPEILVEVQVIAAKAECPSERFASHLSRLRDGA
jgi:hypothetical protein